MAMWHGRHPTVMHVSEQNQQSISSMHGTSSPRRSERCSTPCLMHMVCMAWHVYLPPACTHHVIDMSLIHLRGSKGDSAGSVPLVFFLAAWHWSWPSNQMVLFMSKRPWSSNLGSLACYAQPTCEHGCKRFIYRTCHVMIMSYHCYVFTRHTQVAGMQIMKGIKTFIDEKQPMVMDDTVTEQHLYPMTPWQTYDHAWHVGPNIFSWICRRLSQERALVNWERDANLRPVVGSLWLNSIIMH